MDSSRIEWLVQQNRMVSPATVQIYLKRNATSGDKKTIELARNRKLFLYNNQL